MTTLHYLIAFAGVFVAFLIVEAIALIDGWGKVPEAAATPQTLSSFVWRFLKNPAFFIIFSAFWIWLTVHFFSGGAIF
jgi:hypothetical protein